MADVKLIKRKFQGEVVSAKMKDTAVVFVKRTKLHPLYQKRIIWTKTFPVHNPENKYQVGDIVEIVETRPLSKTKRWKITKKIK